MITNLGMHGGVYIIFSISFIDDDNLENENEMKMRYFKLHAIPARPGAIIIYIFYHCSTSAHWMWTLMKVYQYK